MKKLNNYETFVKESLVTQDKKKELFSYSSLIDSAWRPLIAAAKKFQNISFDLENNDSTGQKKTIYIKRDLRENQPVKYKINCELFKAGGDWEMPVMYFRVEFKNDYSIIRAKHKGIDVKYIWDTDTETSSLHRCYVIIPPVEVGNKLIDNGKGKLVAYNNSELSKDEFKDAKITNEDEKKAWEWLNNIMEELVEERHERLDLNGNDVSDGEDDIEPSKIQDPSEK